jgi:hypothetical protein
MMSRDGGVDEIASKTPQARQGAILVSTGEARVANDIRNQDRRKLSGLAHCVPPAG